MVFVNNMHLVGMRSVLAFAIRRFSRETSKFLNEFAAPDFKRNSLNGIDTRDLKTPGFYPPSVWAAQRASNETLERKLFPKKEIVPGESRPMSKGVAHIAGKPVDDNMSYTTHDKFLDLPLDKKLLANLAILNLSDMTPVQVHTIPIMLANPPEFENNDNVGLYDLMAAAQTGSGKTLAYLLPILQRLMSTYPADAMNALSSSDYQVQFPSALVLAPTRELVHQIRMEASKLCYRSNVRPVALFGGEKPLHQMHQLGMGCHLAIATPGRLLDFLEQRLLNLSFCRSLIIDEADRLLDMGFEPQLRKIIQSTRFGMPGVEGRQTALFSATFPPSVALLARDFLRGLRCISLNIVQGDHPQADGLLVPVWGQAVRRGKLSSEDAFKQLRATVPKEIVQRVEWVEHPESRSGRGPVSSAMLDRLVSVITSLTSTSGEPAKDVERVLVFCNTKREVEQVDRYLVRQGFKSQLIHGDRSQVQRNHSVDLFRKGACSVLVATSVVARGLDFPRVKAVVNFGLPLGLDDYVHRIGRTGRMGQSGCAVTLVSAANVGEDSHLQSVARGICRLVSDSAADGTALPEEFVRAARWKQGGADDEDGANGVTDFGRTRYTTPCPPHRLKSRLTKRSRDFGWGRQ